MTTATLSRQDEEDVLRCVVTDEELEAAAEETALSYTYETSAYQPCCN